MPKLKYKITIKTKNGKFKQLLIKFVNNLLIFIFPTATIIKKYLLSNYNKNIFTCRFHKKHCDLPTSGMSTIIFVNTIKLF